MSNSKAARRKDTADVLKDIKKEKRDLNAISRRNASGTGPVSFGTVSTNMGVSVGFNPNIQIGTGLKVGGDVMMGPIAYNSQEKTVASGVLTLTELINSGTSWTIVNGEGGSADDLVTINGAVFSGQILYLQAKNQAITLKTTGNIHTNDNADVVLSAFNSGAGTGGEVATLIYDDKVTGGNWVVVNVGSGGTGSWVGTATSQLNMGAYSIVGAWGGTSNILGIESDLDMNTYDIKDVDRVYFTADSDANFSNSDNVLLRSSAGFRWNLSDTADNHQFYFNGANEFQIGAVETITNNIQPFTTGDYDVGAPAKEYDNGYIRNLNNVRILQSDSTNLMKIIFDNGTGTRDSDTFISGTLTTPYDRINHTVNGVNQQWWVEDASGNKEIGIASSQNIQFNLGDNWMLLKGRSVPANPASNSQANLFFDSSDDTLKIRKKNSSGTSSTVSLEGSGSGGWVGTATSDLNMATFDIDNIDNINWSGAGGNINFDTTGYLKLSGVNQIYLHSSGVHFYNDIEMMGGVDVDFQTGGTVDFHDIASSNVTGGSFAIPSNPVGYFKVKYRGNDRYIPYYS